MSQPTSSSSSNPSSENLKGYEILSFEGVELTKTEGGQNSFVDLGILHVLYFEESVRFILNINNWNYPLLKRFNFTASSKADFHSRSYTFPSEEGYYTLKLTKINHAQALVNFDTILEHTTTFNYHGEEVPEGSVDATTLASDELSGRELIKKKLARMTNKIAKHLVRSNKDNQNLTHIQNIEELKNVHVDYLTVHEYPREDLEHIISEHRDYSRKAVEKAEESYMSTEKKEKEVTETVTIVNPRRPDEDKILADIDNERKIQEGARNGIEDLRRKEMESIMRERDLQEKLLRRFEEVTVQHVTYKEEALKEEKERTEFALMESEKHMNLERKEFADREQELIDELNKRLDELRNKDVMTEEDHIEFARREKMLLEINEKIRFEAVELEESQNELKEYIKIREQELANKVKLTEEEKAELKRKKKSFKREIVDRLGELHKKKQLTKEEEKEVKRRVKELEKIQKLADAENKKLEKDKVKYLDQTALEMAKLQTKQMQTEEERQKFAQKQADLEAILRNRLEELKKKLDLTEEERIELENRQNELSRLTTLKDAEKFKFEQLQKDFEEEVSMREENLKEMQKMTENEKKQLKGIADELEKMQGLTDSKRRELELQRQMLLEAVRSRETELEAKQRLAEEERLELEKRGNEARMMFEERDRQIEELRKLNYKKETEIVEKKETLVKLDVSREEEIEKQREQLERIKKQEENLMAHNKGLMKGEMKIQGEINKLGDEMEKQPVVSGEIRYTSERVVREEESLSKTVESEETTTTA